MSWHVVCPKCLGCNKDKGRDRFGQRAYRCRDCKNVWVVITRKLRRYSPQRGMVQFSDTGAIKHEHVGDRPWRDIECKHCGNIYPDHGVCTICTRRLVERINESRIRHERALMELYRDSGIIDDWRNQEMWEMENNPDEILDYYRNYKGYMASIELRRTV